ncbi:MAG: hypothetical protein U0821_03615 [Chloroflexota bacterium]
MLVAVLLALGIATGLFLGGIFGVPRILGISVTPGEPRRPPAYPPAVPIGAPEEWAQWSYLTKIEPLWGTDWPSVIRYLEEFASRYPTNEVARDKLYVAYLEDGKRLLGEGRRAAASARFSSAQQLDPDRGEADRLLDELGLPTAPR